MAIIEFTDTNNIKYALNTDSTNGLKGSVTVSTNVTSKYLEIPQTIVHNGDTYTITKIDPQAFKDNTVIENVNIPAFMEEIKSEAFKGCTNIKTIVFPSSVTSLENLSFEGCSSLSTVIFQHETSLPTINSTAFDNIHVDSYAKHRGVSDISSLIGKFNTIVDLNIHILAYSEIEKDKNYFVFYSVSRKNINKLKMRLYQSDGTLVYSKDHVFERYTALEMLNKMKAVGGTFHLGNEFTNPNVNISFTNVYREGWNIKQQKRLIDHVNKSYKTAFSSIANYNVSIDNTNMIINSTSYPELTYTEAGIIIFEQTDSSNHSYPIQFARQSDSQVYANVYREGKLQQGHTYYTIVRVDAFTPTLKYYHSGNNSFGLIKNGIAIPYTVSTLGFSSPYYNFTHSNGTVGTPTLERGKSYIFTRNDSDHPFNLGNDWRQNTTGIPISSTGVSNDVNGVNSIVDNESITISIPSDYSGILKYYCYSHSSMIAEFTIL